MKDFEKFIREYRGAIIGGIIGLIILLTRLDRLILGIILILGGIFVGNYIQQNKNEVKEKIKKFIDKV